MNDALERLKKRNRPTVPNRDTSLAPNHSTSTSLDTSTSRHQDLQISASPEAKNPQTSESEQSPKTNQIILDAQNSVNPDISTSRYQDSQISKPPEPEQPLKTKQTTLRLEQGMSDRLQQLCRENGICREVLIEAMFEYSEANPEALQQALSQARHKNEQRQQLANLKRAKSMMERFG